MEKITQSSCIIMIINASSDYAHVYRLWSQVLVLYSAVRNVLQVFVITLVLCNIITCNLLNHPYFGG